MKWSYLVLTCLLGLGLSACAPVEKTSSPGKDANYHFLMGSSYLKEGQPTMALQEFIVAEKLDQKNIDIQSSLAQTYMIKGAFDLAETHYLKALDLSNGDPQYHNNLGALYLSMGRYQQAADAFRKAAENLLFNNAEVAWTGLGLATYNLGDSAAAESYYQRAIYLNANYFQPYYQLGLLHFTEGRSAEAATAFEKVVKLRPNFVDGHFRLALAYAKEKQLEKARASFQEVLRLDPNSEQGQHATNYLNILQ